MYNKCGDMMKIVMNPKNLIVDSTFPIFRKVRAVIENNEGKFAISVESGKCIFPGGKCEPGESEDSAIRRELLEELGIKFSNELEKKLVIETIYDDYYDFRTGKYGPRYTVTAYYYGKTSDEINIDNMRLTDDEINQDFKSFFISKEELIHMIMSDHSYASNGKYFDDENKIVLENIIQ